MDNLVLSNMLHRPARTMVSVLGIALGVLLIVFTIGLTEGSLRERASREANVGAEIFFRASGAIGLSGTESFRLPVSQRAEIAKIDGVRSVVPIGQNTVTVKDNASGNRLIEGINFDEYAEIAALKVMDGRGLSASSDEAIIDTGWQIQNKFKIGDKIRLYERDFTIVGVYEPAAGARVKIPLQTMQEQLGGEGKATAFLVSLKEGFGAEDVARSLQETFPNNQVLLTKDLEELYMNTIPALNVFLNVVIGVAAVISALVVLLTMYTTVTERTRQIGILKSMGMSRNSIAWVIVQEAVMITFLGVLTGVISAFILKLVLSNITNLHIRLDPKLLAFTFAVGIIGGTLGALYPAIRAGQMDAVEALSYE
jgi:putative ABC transport system permease protein